jgi:hypothetical protein
MLVDTVNEGGQAIVGNVRHGGQGLPRKPGDDPMNRKYSFQKALRCSGHLEAHARSVQSRAASLTGGER